MEKRSLLMRFWDKFWNPHINPNQPVTLIAASYNEKADAFTCKIHKSAHVTVFTDTMDVRVQMIDPVTTKPVFFEFASDAELVYDINPEISTYLGPLILEAADQAKIDVIYCARDEHDVRRW